MQRIIIASGPVIVESDKVLLNKHGDTNFWKFCGGKVEDKDDTLIDNAKRETREEMGIEIEILNEEPFMTFTRKLTDQGVFDIILVHFLSKRLNEINPGPEIREWAWHDLDNLPPDLGPNIIPALKHFGFL